MLVSGTPWQAALFAYWLANGCYGWITTSEGIYLASQKGAPEAMVCCTSSGGEIGAIIGGDPTIPPIGEAIGETGGPDDLIFHASTSCRHIQHNKQYSWPV